MFEYVFLGFVDGFSFLIRSRRDLGIFYGCTDVELLFSFFLESYADSMSFVFRGSYGYFR